MQKTPAIFLLFCFVSYHFGYYASYFSKKAQVEKVWFERIYGGSAAELPEMSIEIPLSVAYMPDQEDFRESNASFEKEGRHYRIIKQRYKKDTLEIVYVPDVEKNQLQSLVAEWAKSLSSKHSEGTTGLSALKAPFQEYDQMEHGLPEYAFRPMGKRTRPALAPNDASSAALDASCPPPERA
ncbi:MAG: hypothetical protein ACKOA4_05345 [Haliscomenobacter sp.]